LEEPLRSVFLAGYMNAPPGSYVGSDIHLWSLKRVTEAERPEYCGHLRNLPALPRDRRKVENFMGMYNAEGDRCYAAGY
jgi:hypothetical protein